MTWARMRRLHGGQPPSCLRRGVCLPPRVLGRSEHHFYYNVLECDEPTYLHSTNRGVHGMGRGACSICSGGEPPVMLAAWCVPTPEGVGKVGTSLLL
jgi:hypothetical protein